MKCRGHETRQRIVRDYEVKPKAHIKLLANQQKHSDAGATIKDKYYVFSAVHKIDSKEEVIQCGMFAAKDFLKLINQKGLPLFNPLTGNSNVNDRQEYDNRGSRNLQSEKWNKTAIQLYNAIMWLFLLWNIKPDTPLFNLEDDVIKNKAYEPTKNNIKSVNTAIKNGGKGKTLTEMINVYREYNNIKEEFCNFSSLQDKVNNFKDKHGNTIKSYF